MVAGESLLGVLAGDLVWLFCWLIEGLTFGVEQMVGEDVRLYLPSRPRSSWWWWPWWWWLLWIVGWSSLSRILKSKIKLNLARCFKITEKVSFDIASEASYVYILSGQKLIKNAKNGSFWRVFKTWSLWSNSVTRQVSFIRTKIGEKCQHLKIQMRHFE